MRIRSVGAFVSPPPQANNQVIKSKNQCPAELDNGVQQGSIKCEKQSQAWLGEAICAEAALLTQGGPRSCPKAYPFQPQKGLYPGLLSEERTGYLLG